MSTPVLPGGRWLVVRGGGVGTLLSPEGAGMVCLAFSDRVSVVGSVLRLLGRRPGGCARGLWRGGRPYFENCTVDASIFVAN